MQKIYQKNNDATKIKSGISGCYLLNLTKNIDQRGYFFNILSKNLFFNKYPLNSIKQINISENKKKGTLRGLHFQSAPYSEKKIVICLKGKIFDVVLDLRKYSKTFGQHISFELSDKKNQMLFIPKNCAHGYQTLVDNSLVLYLHSQDYKKKHDSSINPFDKNLNIKWPIKNKIISNRDKNAKYFKDAL